MKNLQNKNKLYKQIPV